ncbi:ATP-binding protein (plasmid) [Halorientalis pallida]|uniref:ATP-binding protein n=1 Tax=Halorientalis pallida TaxID=2479928 RepID=UPI003C700287
MGDGRELPLGLENHLDFVEPVNSFEFLIHKPAGHQRFHFYFGIDQEDDLDQLHSKTTSQYPSNYRFDTDDVALSECFEETPHLCRWVGKEQKRHDWMMLLSEFDDDSADRSPLSDLLETAITTEKEWLFQAVFEPRVDWTRKAESQKRNLKMGVTSGFGFFVQTFLDRLVGVSEHEQRSRHRNDTPAEEVGSAEQGPEDQSRHKATRMAQLNNKDPQTSFNVSIRCASSDEKVIRDAESSFSQLSGSFYQLEGEYLGQDDSEYQRLLNHELTRPTPTESFWKSKPMLVANANELANFVTVPTIDSLPKASRGASGGGPAAHSPLTTPDEEVFQSFDDGMCIGKAATVVDSPTESTGQEALESVAEWRNQVSQREAIHLDAETLTRHYLRAGSTGSGKTVAGINDLLTAHEELSGPTFLLDSKGGDMCDNYLRTHRYIFDDLDDVEYIKIPEDNQEVPGLPFFDLRPLIYQAGRSRESAIQDTIDHFYEVLRFAVGEEKVEQAWVGNDVLKAFIRTLFEEERAEYPAPEQARLEETRVGGDAFPISDLYDMALEYEMHKSVPETSSATVAASLQRHTEKNERQFKKTAGAVTNRISKLNDRDFIWRMLDYKPEWDHNRGWYAEDENVLDLREILHSNKVVVIDTGELRDDASQMFNVLFLSHLWTAIKSLHTPSRDDYVVNCLIEESAPLTRSNIVHNKLLPEGREFDLSLGLVMQYPAQVLGDDPHKNRSVYTEVLNNINTKIIGNVSTDDDLPDSLFHGGLDSDEVRDYIQGLPEGQFIAQLPPTGFQEQQPEIMTLEPLPLPPGHAETDSAIRPMADATRAKTRQKYCISPEQTANRLTQLDTLGNESSSEAGSAAPSTSTDLDIGDDVDDSRPAEALSNQEQTFLQDVVDYWNGDLPFYERGDPMATREFDRRDLADGLVDDEFLREVRLANRYTYYWPTNKTLAAFDDLEIVWGTEQGDPRESPRHKVIVSLLKRIYSNRGFTVKTYIGGDDTSGTFDLVATHPQKEHRVVEVETSRPDREDSPLRKDDVLGDYKKLAEFCETNEAMALWVVESQNAAHHLLDILEEEGYVADHPSRNTQGYGKITEQTDAGSGLDKVTGFGIILDRTVGEGRYEDPDSSSVQ